MLTKTRIICGMLLGAVLTNPAIATAQEANSQPPPIAVDKKPSDAKPKRVRKVHLASSMLGVSIDSESAQPGQIDDLAFDLETGHLALIVAVQKSKEGMPLYMLLPFLQYQTESKLEWQDDQSVKKLPESFTRSLVEDVYVTYDRDIYWLRFCKQLEDSLKSDQFDKQNFQLKTFSFLRNRPVVDIQGETIGKIEDLGVNAANGRIVYCVLETPTHELRAIPLGAFVMESTAYRWTIELSKAQILEFETFDKSSPPSRVSRGWTEYVSVRYGREGLQPQKKTNERKRSDSPQGEVSSN